MTDSPSRTSATPITASASVRSPSRSPSEIWSTARPVSHGIATVQTIASAASSSDQKTPALVRAQETEESTKGVHATNTIGRGAPGSGSAIRPRTGVHSRIA